MCAEFGGKQLIIQGFIAFSDYTILAHFELRFRGRTTNETPLHSGLAGRLRQAVFQEFFKSFPQISTEKTVFKFGTYWYCAYRK
jgi:hypothetical protein